MQTQRGYFCVGLLLLTAFALQELFALKWPWLVRMQANETFKQITGLVLVSFIAHQWYLSLLRLRGQTELARTKLPAHRRWGAFAPLIFYAHSHRIGHAYLFLLSCIYFANTAIGLCNQEIVHISKKWFLMGWMILHVSLSVFMVILAGYHSFIAFYYE